MIVGKGNAVCVECVRRNHVSPCLEKFLVNPLNRVRAGPRQEVVAALQRGLVRVHDISAEIGLDESQPLNHRSHGTVENDDLPFGELPQRLGVKKSRISRKFRHGHVDHMA